MPELIVTIDGPAASGKSTMARLLARRIGATFLDTGAMYRAVTLAALRSGIDLQDQDAVLGLIASTRFEFIPQGEGMAVIVDGVEVTDAIRDPEVTAKVRFIAAADRVRARLVALQRAFAQGHGRIVTEGRDQGTVAFPHAQVKIFLTADPAERVRRRQAELAAKGHSEAVAQVQEAVADRDLADESRRVGPLRPAPDAVAVDTTGLAIDQSIEKIYQVVMDWCGRG